MTLGEEMTRLKMPLLCICPAQKRLNFGSVCPPFSQYNQRLVMNVNRFTALFIPKPSLCMTDLINSIYVTIKKLGQHRCCFQIPTSYQDFGYLNSQSKARFTRTIGREKAYLMGKYLSLYQRLVSSLTRLDSVALVLHRYTQLYCSVESNQVKLDGSPDFH